MAITQAILEVNQTLPKDQKISTDLDAPLYGPQGLVDSVTLVLLIVAIEQKIEESLQVTIVLGDYAAGLGEYNPFKNIKTLCEHIAVLINSGNYAA